MFNKNTFSRIESNRWNDEKSSCTSDKVWLTSYEHFAVDRSVPVTPQLYSISISLPRDNNLNYL